MPTVTKLFPSGGLELAELVGDHLLRRVYQGYTKREALREFRETVFDAHTIWEQDKNDPTHCPKCGARSDLVQAGKRVSIEQCLRESCRYTFQVIFK